MSKPYYEQSPVAWCVLGKLTWGVVTAVRVPEHRAQFYVRHYGFQRLIGDHDFPVPYDASGSMPDIVAPASVQSNPRRHLYRVELEHYPEGDLDA